MKGKLLSRVRLFAIPWTAAYQAPLSMGFSRQEYYIGINGPKTKTPLRKGLGVGLQPIKLPNWLSGKRTHLSMQEIREMWVQSLGWEDPLENHMATPVFLLGKSHGRGLAGYSPWGHRRLGHDLTIKQ